MFGHLWGLHVGTRDMLWFMIDGERRAITSESSIVPSPSVGSIHTKFSGLANVLTQESERVSRTFTYAQ
jgi:hypothetical protein